MKWPPFIYIVLAAIGIFTAIMMPLVISKWGSNAVPLWTHAVSPGPLSAPHAFIGNDCESCHLPNRGITATKCVTCHAWAPELLMKPATAFHANVGECRGCHIEHGGAARRPITMNHAALDKMAFNTAGTAAPLNCSACHATQDKHLGFFGKECADCHVVATWKIAGYLHPSNTSTDCNQCHKPPPSHYMMHFNMMDKTISGQKSATVEQCFKCHQTDSFNDIRGVGWIKMH